MARDAGSTRRAYLTTHQVARLLGVSLPTVVNWIEAGRISAHRTPGGHRRIGREELVRFSKLFDYPLPPEFQVTAGPARVLIADADLDLGEMIQNYLTMRGGFEVRVAPGVLEAGYLLGAFQPHLVLLDLSMPGLDPLRLLRLVRAEQDSTVRLFACTALRDARAVAVTQEFDGVIEKPIRWDGLHDTLRRALA